MIWRVGVTGCRALALAAAAVAAALAGCGGGGRDGSTGGFAGTTAGKTAPVAFTLTSSAFADGGRIPRRFTCDGDDERPPLAWDAPPAGTRGLLLVVEDPDAPGGTFLHELAWGLAPGLRALPAGKPAPSEGRNGFGTTGWRGPCPPPGPEHRYVFRLIALDRPVDAAPGAARAEVEPQVAAHALGEARLVGRYGR